LFRERILKDRLATGLQEAVSALTENERKLHALAGVPVGDVFSDSRKAYDRLGQALARARVPNTRSGLRLAHRFEGVAVSPIGVCFRWVRALHIFAG
jgi:hypothetical protein